MRFDVDSELADYVRRQRIAERHMLDPVSEHMLLAALLADDAIADDGATVNAIALCDDLELEDFADYRCRAAFRALRNLQARGEPHGPYEVFAEIEREDRARETRVADEVTLVFLSADLVQGEPRVTVNWILCAQKRLREMANHRRLA